MRPHGLSLALSLISTGHASPQIIPPELGEQMCRDSEQSYKGPPIPRVSAPIFSGAGCPTQGLIGYNYRGLWSCHRSWDTQFIVTDLLFKAEQGQLVKGDCAVTFSVDELGAGWQVALSSGQVDTYAEMAPRSQIGSTGGSGWEGGVKTKGSKYVGDNRSGRSVAKLNRYGLTLSFYGLSIGWSPCSAADRVVGNLTINYTVELDARQASGRALVSTGSWTDEQSGEDVINAATLNFKWYIRKCAT